MSEERSVPGDAEAAAPAGDNLPAAPPGDQASASREALIRQAAYARYQHRGAESGHEVEDWLAAEADIEAAEPSIDKSA